MSGTIWSLLPPVIAIILALLTKEVYSSLIIGILFGALFYSGFNLIGTVDTVFSILSSKIGDNGNILIFLVLLGILVALITKSGASSAYGKWASRSIHGKRGALLSTIGLGVLIFVDDYFNCLTVGTVMRPVTDRFGITRAKLAYIIDATAAPVCIIAPISSWAAAVTSSLPEGSGIDGFSLFMGTIPFNLYALLTIFMLLCLVVLQFDFGPMKKYEQAAPAETAPADTSNTAGKVIDLILPIAILILSCIFGMLYTGGILDGAGIADAFANCDASKGLVLGSFVAIVFTTLLYLPRKILSFRTFTDCFVDGFKAMTSAIMILCLAWTLSGICSADYLDAGGFVKSFVEGSHFGFEFIPAVFFLVALGLAFATGTSWGTFGILIPIAVAVFAGGADLPLLTITVSASLAGAVCGDHISPISDTTILSSAGAECNHLDHVSTQIPYALLVAGVCLVGFIIAGFTQNALITILSCIILLALILVLLYSKNKTSKA